jgi:hypothetical protein
LTDSQTQPLFLDDLRGKLMVKAKRMGVRESDVLVSASPMKMQLGRLYKEDVKLFVPLAEAEAWLAGIGRCSSVRR